MLNSYKKKVAKAREELLKRSNETILNAQKCLNDEKFKKYRQSYEDMRSFVWHEMKIHPKNDPQYKDAIVYYVTTLEILEKLLEEVTTDAGADNGIS